MCRDSLKDACRISVRSSILMLLVFWPLMGQSLERIEKAGSEMVIGERAPRLVLPIIANAPQLQQTETPPAIQTRFALLDLSEYHGKVVYLDFWHSSCGPCRDSMPLLDQLNSELASSRVRLNIFETRAEIEIIAVNTDSFVRDALDFLDHFPVSYPVVGDPASIAARNYGVEALPMGFFIGKDGLVRGIHRGFVPGDISKIRGRLVALSGKHGFTGDAARRIAKDVD